MTPDNERKSRDKSKSPANIRIHSAMAEEKRLLEKKEKNQKEGRNMKMWV